MDSRTKTDDEQRGRERLQREFIRTHPPRIRFATDIRDASASEEATLDHFEFMMALMEAHPIIPFEDCSFGSDLLDARRALAYHIVIRELGHARSLIVNTNIRNRVGVGISLRCMLEIYAFVKFFCMENRLKEYRLIELFLLGQSFATGGWYELKKVWEESHGESLPEDAKNFIEKVFGLPRVGTILKPTHAEDQGFSYLYSRYSEFVHPAFARPRNDFEQAMGCKEPHLFGSSDYFRCEVAEGAPIKLILEDVAAGNVCLDLFWNTALQIDPHFDDELRPQIVDLLKNVYESS